MEVSVKTRLKVSSVTSVPGREGRESIKITFVEASVSPPMVAMTPQNVPEEVGNVVFQVQKGLKKALPKALRERRPQKIILVFTPEELEAFHVKPYPNQVYQVTITKGGLQFEKVP